MVDSLNLMNNDIALKQLSAGKVAAPKTDEASPGEAIGAFGDILKASMQQVNKLQNDANKATETYAVGGPIELHQVMISVEKAELALEMTTQIRNKVLSAYQEISRMGV